VSPFAKTAELIEMCVDCLTVVLDGDSDHGRPHVGQMWSADPPRKMDEKLKSENPTKKQFSEWGCWG